LFDLDAGHGGLLFALRAGRILKLGTEPADDAAPFLLGALGVQRYEAFEDLFVRQIVRPASVKRSRASSKR
jgi:hypothetical protein